MNDMHVSVPTICVDVEGSKFNGLKAEGTKYHNKVLNDDAEARGLTRRWYTVEEYLQKEGIA
jgi:hypothetical protein